MAVEVQVDRAPEQKFNSGDVYGSKMTNVP
jgi:hypothetical protein